VSFGNTSQFGIGNSFYSMCTFLRSRDKGIFISLVKQRIRITIASGLNLVKKYEGESSEIIHMQTNNLRIK
jgi:hypothetical protein